MLLFLKIWKPCVMLTVGCYDFLVMFVNIFVQLSYSVLLNFMPISKYVYLPAIVTVIYFQKAFETINRGWAGELDTFLIFIYLFIMLICWLLSLSGSDTPTSLMAIANISPETAQPGRFHKCSHEPHLSWGRPSSLSNTELLFRERTRRWSTLGTKWVLRIYNIEASVVLWSDDSLPEWGATLEMNHTP